MNSTIAAIVLLIPIALLIASYFLRSKRFSVRESLNYGWKAFTSHTGFFIAFLVIIGLVTVVPGVIADQVLDKGGLANGLVKFVFNVVGLIMGMIATRISLDIYDSGEADTSRLGELAGIFWRYLGGKLLYGLLVFLGMLLIVPGIIFSYMFLYVGYLIIDRRLGPIESFKASKVVTDGCKWDLLFFTFLTAIINLLGALPLFLGLFVTIPVTLMASAYVYRQLSPKQTV